MKTSVYYTFLIVFGIMYPFPFDLLEHLLELFVSNTSLDFSYKVLALFILSFNLFQLKIKSKDDKCHNLSNLPEHLKYQKGWVIN